MSERDQNTDFAEKIEDLLDSVNTQLRELAHEFTAASNIRIDGLNAEIAGVPEGSVEQGKLTVIGVAYQADVDAIKVLRDLCADFSLNIERLQSLRRSKFNAVQAMHAHLQSLEAGNGPTLQRAAGSKLH
ncbi:hypothetical protein [Agrobacterium tumefaciens]|uniref:hypothetical protein n=1 Tax=Agrobacterium tumefaciens TaxID=358 RepID=UPI0015721657|nr:hypothetical protein [Agrobacterium tumefaciens]